ncbi:hypothetical protein Pogu_0880 [Pyrobaculum oguniense TE7]|uniref:Uncharacterized protein n=1 Tax=Pyrobaculum oguniense (strain DSM 13380 / JCM 10595 / TE7) TaxID=698757 RepID=H6Q9S2_PYROT|nr:hypothetical protein Pogu_0880 [Pyrobaculum oguniense TE7]
MIVVRSGSVENLIWQVRSLLPQIETTPILLAQRQVGNYLIGLGTLGYIYEALSSVLETLVEAQRMAKDLGLRDYSVVIGPTESYLTTMPIPEVMPPLPQPKPVPPLPREEVRLNTFNCSDLTRGLVKFCVDNVEIAYYLSR